MNYQTTNQTKTWAEANAIVRDLAKNAGGLPIFAGAGQNIPQPHVLLLVLDAQSGEGTGFHVCVYPQGDNGMAGLGLGRPCERHLIKVG